MVNRRRPSREERREQIVSATIALVAVHGVRGTSLVRIASELGITYPALYAHFANKREILIAALDVLFKEIQEMHRASFRENAVDHLREIGIAHSRLVASAEDGFVLPLFEFIAAAPKEDLREILGAREITLVEDLAEIARRGQRDGTIIPETDPEQIAWMIVSRAWTEDIAALMGLRAHWTEERSRRMLEMILKSIAVPNAGHFDAGS
jgi:AcrR family transcriptional regulator